MASWEDYFYPGTDVLRNKLGIEDKEELQRTERRLVEQRLTQGCPEGNFDLAHLQAIHRHLFQDVYEWAGELRTVAMYKTSGFLPPDRIEMKVHEVHGRAVQADFGRNMNVWEFSDMASQIIGDINDTHPFREGNGRTQFEFLEQLGERAGHNVDTTRIDRAAWIEASIETGRGYYGAMNDQIRAAIVPTLERTPPVEKQTGEQVVKDDELLRAQELRAQRDVQQQVLKDMMASAERSGKDAAEKEAIRRDFAEECRVQDAVLARAQQQRAERLELQQRGPPDGRDR